MSYPYPEQNPFTEPFSLAIVISGITIRGILVILLMLLFVAIAALRRTRRNLWRA